MFKFIQRIARFLIILSTLGFLFFAFIIVYYVFGFHKESQLSTPQVAFWLEHKWSSDPSANYSELAKQIENIEDSALYFHVGPIQEDGSFADDLNISKSNLDSLSSKNYAWIGQIRSKIDLADSAVRSAIIQNSKSLLQMGFDGIHVDIEPIKPGDTDFLSLMVEMREAIPDTDISVAMDEWQPHFLTQWVAGFFHRDIISYWTSAQVKELLPYVNELVVMTYDTGFKDPKLYALWVEQQTVALSKLMDEDTSLLIGLPVYSQGTNFDPSAENIRSGLVGYTRGLTNIRAKYKSIKGIAIYPYWEMSDSDWQILFNYLENGTDTAQ